jgi:hypothetical protein
MVKIVELFPMPYIREGTYAEPSRFFLNLNAMLLYIIKLSVKRINIPLPD